jgi:hypothetical protein
MRKIMADDELLKIGERPLKKVSLISIEDAVANSISAITNTKYDVSIIDINFEPDSTSWFRDKAEIRIRIRLHKD